MMSPSPDSMTRSLDPSRTWTPRRLALLALFLFLLTLTRATPAHAQQIDIVGPPDSGEFGDGVTVLPNGNIVVTDPKYDEGGVSDIGAVYLYDGADLSLISVLKGSSAGDQVGSSGVVALSNGNYVVRSPRWDDGGTVDAGAVTWGDGDTGITATVSAANSLVGSSANDFVGSSGVRALSNGNYVVASPGWDDGGTADVGAVTWGDGTTGVSGAVSAANSLVGSSANDNVGTGVTALGSGNYVIASSSWDNGGMANAGAVTWADGATGTSGAVSAANSLVGSSANDRVGNFGVRALSNGNYVVPSPNWDDGGTADVGAATWGDGATGVTGAVSAANSLVGSSASDGVGSHGITALSNGNYVVRSTSWDDGGMADVGAATWGDGTTGISGAVSTTNSLVGSSANDRVGSHGVVALDNGNYVVASPDWDDGGTADVGAATWGDGATGITGAVSAANSLVGSGTGDQVGSSGVSPLSNGNYVVRSTSWDDGGMANVGAATWGDGAAGITGTVSAANSLVGSSANDNVGISGVRALSNGNYVVASPTWDDGGIADVGAVTWGDGATGISGAVSAANSLVGSSASDKVSGNGVRALSNGNYVVASGGWDDGGTADVGAATWGNGETGITGAVSAANSLVGSSTDDKVGNDVVALSNGNYVVRSLYWDNGGMADAGAATWGDGISGISGAVSAANSLVGSSTDDNVSSHDIIALSNGNYVVRTPNWDDGGTADVGAATWGDGATGITGAVSAANSLVGSSASDNVGSHGVTALSNGNYVVASLYWDDGAITDAGAVTYGDGANGTSGPVTTTHSVLGTATNGISDWTFDAVRSRIVVGRAPSNIVSLFPSGAVGLAITKTVDDANPEINDTLTYTVVVSNVGNVVATDGVISDVNPTGLTYVPGSALLDPSSAGAIGAPPQLATGLTITAGHSVTLTFQASINGGLADGVTLTNTASITATEHLTPTTDSVTVTVASPPVGGVTSELALAGMAITGFEAGGGGYGAGILDWVWTILNPGAAPVSNIYFDVVQLSPPGVAVVHNADGGPAGQGARVSVPNNVLDPADGQLDPAQQYAQLFEIGLLQSLGFTFQVQAFGMVGTPLVAGEPQILGEFTVEFDPSMVDDLRPEADQPNKIFVPLIQR